MESIALRPVLGRKLTGSSFAVTSTFNHAVNQRQLILNDMLIPFMADNPKYSNLHCAAPNHEDAETKNELVSGIKAILHKKLPDRPWKESSQQIVPEATVSSNPTSSRISPPKTGYLYSGWSNIMDHSIGHFNSVNVERNTPENGSRNSHGSLTTKPGPNNQQSDNTQWLRCDICKCSVNSAYQMKIHNDGKKHKKKVEMMLRKKGMGVTFPHEHTENLSFDWSSSVLPVHPPMIIPTAWNISGQNANTRGSPLHARHDPQSPALWNFCNNSPSSLVYGGECRVRRDSDSDALSSSDTDSTASC